MTSYIAKPPNGAMLNRSHPLAKWLTGAWLMNEGGGLTAYDVAGGNRGNGTLTGGPTWGNNQYGRAVACTATTHYVALGTPTDSLFAAASGSIVIVQRKHDTTLRESSSFATTIEGVGSPKRVNVHMPYSDGTVYFDWGGVVSGTTRLAVGGLSFDILPHVWMFTVGGGLGMRMYRDGALVGSNAATPTRTLDAANLCRINTFAPTNNGDIADYSLVMTFSAALTLAHAKSFAADPFLMFRRRSLPVSLFAAGGGAPAGTILHVMNQMYAGAA